MMSLKIFTVKTLIYYIIMMLKDVEKIFSFAAIEFYLRVEQQHQPQQQQRQQQQQQLLRNFLERATKQGSKMKAQTVKKLVLLRKNIFF